MSQTNMSKQFFAETDWQFDMQTTVSQIKFFLDFPDVTHWQLSFRHERLPFWTVQLISMVSPLCTVIHWLILGRQHYFCVSVLKGTQYDWPSHQGQSCHSWNSIQQATLPPRNLSRGITKCWKPHHWMTGMAYPPLSVYWLQYINRLGLTYLLWNHQSPVITNQPPFPSSIATLTYFLSKFPSYTDWLVHHEQLLHSAETNLMPPHRQPTPSIVVDVIVLLVHLVLFAVQVITATCLTSEPALITHSLLVYMPWFVTPSKSSTGSPMGVRALHFEQASGPCSTRWSEWLWMDK